MQRALKFLRSTSTLSRKPLLREDSITSISKKGFHRISYFDWGKENSDDTVFCLHGLTRNRHDFDKLASRLSKRRRVICPDTAGRGKSDWLRNPDDYQLQQYNMDLTVLISRIGCQNFDIIGTSMGGLMGIIMASMENSPVRKLVINDIAPEVPYEALRRLSLYLGEDPLFDNKKELEKYLRETLSPFGPMTDADWKHMAKTSARKSDEGFRLAFDPAIASNYQRYWLLAYFNLWRFWKRIECPVLVLRGKESDFLTDTLLAKMKNRLPHMDVIEFDDVGHAPTLNAPQQIEPVIEWLDNH